MEKVEFGSSAWVMAVRHVLQETVADVDLSGIEFSMCEEFLDPPAHLRREGSDKIGWHWRIRGGVVEVNDGLADDVDLRIVGDYHTLLPMARTVLADEPSDEARQKVIAAQMSQVRIEGDPSRLPAFIIDVGLHD